MNAKVSHTFSEVHIPRPCTIGKVSYFSLGVFAGEPSRRAVVVANDSKSTFLQLRR